MTSRGVLVLAADLALIRACRVWACSRPAASRKYVRLFGVKRVQRWKEDLGMILRIVVQLPC